MSQKVLLVDDEPNVLSMHKRQLRSQFDMEFAEGGMQALEILKQRGPFAVVVSDMQMPDLDGLQLLAKVAESSPDTVRIMLTGNADQGTAANAINQSGIFRFLNKPCASEDLTLAILAGLQQFERIRAEHELLSNTLNGSIGLMSEVLSLANPHAFGRSVRLRELAHKLCKQLNVAKTWEIELAAMLSQIGLVSLPDAVIERIEQGRPLTSEEQRMLDECSEISANLVRRIPRLEGVAKLILAKQPADAEEDHVLRLEIEILQAAIDYVERSGAGNPKEVIQEMLDDSFFPHNPEVLEALSQVIEVQMELKSIRIGELKPGMILEECVETQTGNVLIGEGQEVNDTLIARLRNFARTPQGVQEPIRVRCAVDSMALPQPV